jgi:hypothetical protein
MYGRCPWRDAGGWARRARCFSRAIPLSISKAVNACVPQRGPRDVRASLT